MVGWNPIHGFDTGPPPPHAGQAVSVAYVQGVPFQYVQGVPVYVAQPQPQHVYVQQQPQPLPQYIYVQQPAQRQQIYINTPATASASSSSTGGYEEFEVEKCLVHVITTKMAPWEQAGPLQYKKVKIPVNVSVKDVMQNMGCNNKDPKKNVMTEVVEKGNGGWTTGLKFSVSRLVRVESTR